uniref:C2H2-type domain-containing protein n=1 Tax=Anopheles christyi TaxID=43041 RepID=A0A182K7U4_9DIPT
MWFLYLRSMCFDYDHYFAEETFIIDDFGEICEDVVRIAGANSQYLCKDFEAELRRQESPPPGSLNASSRCFEKEVSSLFSEMEYLTEVSPGTDVVLSETNAITIAVNPSEFSCKRALLCEPPIVTETLEKEVREFTVEASIPTAEPRKTATHTEQTVHSNLSPPVEYQRILNNYIQKGRRKLEASSYSKMKASCLVAERWKAPKRSTSSLETVTKSMQPSARTNPGSSTPITAIVSQLPATNIDHPASISETVEMYQSSPMSPSCPTVQPAGQNRSSAGLLKTARMLHCRDCGLSYASSELLRKHCCIIAEQYQCHLCLREFKKRKTLDHHMKSHDKVFSTDNDLRK